MAEGIDIDGMRETLHRVTQYRQVCEAVRSRANHTLFNGVLFLGLTFAWSTQIANNAPYPVILYVFAAIGVGELLVGLWMKFAPSPEGLLADGLFELAFAGSVGVRVFMAVNGGGAPSTLSLVIGAWSLFNAFKTFQAYGHLKRAFQVRPTRAQLAYVDDLLADVREGEPETDPASLVFDTRPPVRAKLLGDVAMVVIGRDDVSLAERRQLRVDRVPTAQHPDAAVVTVFGTDLPEFDIDAATWKNYASWQTAGGNPPPPAVVRPARRPGDDS